MSTSLRNPFDLGREWLERQEQAAVPAVCTLDVTLVTEDDEALLTALRRRVGDLPGALTRACGERFPACPGWDLRLRVIVCHDLYWDETGLESTGLEPFLTPEAVPLHPASRAGGKSLLEGLYCAICGPWRRHGEPRAHLVVCLAGAAPPLPLEEPTRRADRQYAARLRPHRAPDAPPVPATLQGLRRLWEHPGASRLDLFNSRLLLYAPAGMDPWEEIRGWNRVLSLRPDPGLTSLAADLAGAMPEL